MATTSDPQSLLSASFQVPSMLMTYLTSAGLTTTPAASDTVNSDAESTTTHAIESKHQDQNNSNTTPPPNNRRHRSLLLPSPTRSLPLDHSENMSYASGEYSREGSVMSANGRSAKRFSKPKTSYSICQPAPKGHTLQKIQVRARPLLQLHKLNVDSRPTPALELLPSAIFSSSLTRAIGKKYRPRHGLCPADLAVVKADSYHKHEESGAEEDESRDVIALICKGRWRDNLAPGRAKIFLENGADYEAYALPNGGYEFTSTDHHGLTTTVRWVLKRPRMRRSRSSMTDMDLPVTDPLSKRFSFSTILPNSRRHPIIANLTSTTIDIQDIYNMPNPSPSNLSPSTPPSPNEGDALKGEPVETTPALRTLITVTALWVGIREGWSPGYRYDDFISRSPSARINRSPTKAAGDSLDAGRDDHRRRSASIVRMFKGGAHKRQSVQSASAATDGSDEDYVMSRNSSLRSVRRPRAESSATVIHRTPFSRHDINITPRYTTGSISTHELDHEDDVTEDEEEDDEEGKGENVKHIVNASTAPKNSSPPNSTSLPALRLIDASDESRPSTPPTIDLDDKVPTPKKRTDSATHMTPEPHNKLEVKPEPKPKRGRIMRVLLCGLS